MRDLLHLRRLDGGLFALLLPGRTCSAGVTRATGEESVSLLLAAADAALHEAERAGRDGTRAHLDAGVASA